MIKYFLSVVVTFFCIQMLNFSYTSNIYILFLFLLDSSGTTILHIGIQWANEDMLMQLLMHPAVQRLKNKADERGMTPLICAARYNNVFAIKILCKLNVDVTRTMYKKGENALHYAARLEDPKVAELLLQHNSLPEFINASNEDGNN